jgi:hypothetical protein
MKQAVNFVNFDEILEGFRSEHGCQLINQLKRQSCAENALPICMIVSKRNSRKDMKIYINKRVFSGACDIKLTTNRP